jgi:hypothetical protein
VGASNPSLEDHRRGWHSVCSSVKSIQKEVAMNLAMQLRRALVTLGLAAVAIVCVAARSATMADLRTGLPELETPAVSATIAKEALDVAHVITVVRDAVPLRMSRNRPVRNSIVVRCAAIAHG